MQMMNVKMTTKASSIHEARVNGLMKLLRQMDDILLDTNVLFEAGKNAEAFFEGTNSNLSILEDALNRAGGKKITLLSDVLGEIERLRQSEKPETARLADAARQRALRLLQGGFAVIAPLQTENAFGDAGFMAWFASHPNHRCLLITLDKSLAADVLEFSDLRMQQMGSVSNPQPVSIRKLDGFGFLEYHVGSKVVTERKGGDIDYFVGEGPAPVAPPEPIPLRSMPDEGSVLTVRMPDGRIGTVMLSEELGFGAESVVFDVGGNVVAKIFENPTTWHEQKINLLLRRKFDIAGAALPEAALYDEDGMFCGYLMPRAQGVKLGALFTDAGRQRHAPSWDRTQFIDVARRIADVMVSLRRRGIVLGDINEENVIVNAATRCVTLIDLDSCQVGVEKWGVVYPAAGASASYAAPEVQAAFREGRVPVFTKKSDDFAETVLLTQCILTGLHPFRSIANTSDVVAQNLSERIEQRLLPFGNAENHRSALPPEPMAARLWSYLPASLKRSIHSTLTEANPADRISIKALAAQLHYYVDWLEDDEVVWPEKNMLSPTMNKPFIVNCAGECHKPFDLANVTGAFTRFGKDGKPTLHFCPDCTAKHRQKRKEADKRLAANAFGAGVIQWNQSAPRVQKQPAPATQNVTQTTPASAAAAAVPAAPVIHAQPASAPQPPSQPVSAPATQARPSVQSVFERLLQRFAL